MEFVENGEAAFAPNAPTREAYQFAQWNTDFSAVTSDLGVVAVYESLDLDNDGVLNALDSCQNTVLGDSVNSYGCSVQQLADDDNDGVINANDLCETSEGELVDENGCAIVLDSDNDGIADVDDACPNTLEGEDVIQNGCSIAVVLSDDDEDGIINANDLCESSAQGVTVDENGL